MPTPCTRCGAPLPETPGARVCAACGQVHDAGAPFAPPPGRPPTAQMSPRAANRSNVGGCLAALIIPALIVVLVVGVGLVIRGGSDGGDDDVRVEADLSPTSGDLLVLPGDLGDDARVVTMATPIGGDGGRVIALVDLEEGPVWEAAIVPDDVYTAQMVATDEVVVVSLDRRVVGLDRADGAVRWESEASDVVDPTCTTCFALVGGSLVVLGTDGEVTVFDPDSGEVRWTHRFASPVGRVVPLGDDLLLVDDPEDEDPTTALSLVRVDPVDGTEISRSTPGCLDRSVPDATHAVSASPDLPVIPVPDSDDVVLVYGLHPGCIQRWDVATGAERWSSIADEPSLDWHGAEDQPWALGRSELVVAGLESWVVVGLAEGGMRVVPAPADTTVEPSVHVAGDVFVGAVTTVRGTPELALVAHDLRSGDEAWTRTVGPEVALAAVGPHTSSETVFDQPIAAVVPVGDGLRLLTVGPPGPRFAVSAVDLTTGEGDIVGVAPIRADTTGSLSARIDTVRDGHAVVDIDGVLHVIDLGTGAVGVAWGR